jgi:hypothetical protein
MAKREEVELTERERAVVEVRGILERLDHPTLALLYKTLHDGLRLRIDTVDIAIAKLRR